MLIHFQTFDKIITCWVNIVDQHLIFASITQLDWTVNKLQKRTSLSKIFIMEFMTKSVCVERWIGLHWLTRTSQAKYIIWTDHTDMEHFGKLQKVLVLGEKKELKSSKSWCSPKGNSAHLEKYLFLVFHQTFFWGVVQCTSADDTDY